MKVRIQQHRQFEGEMTIADLRKQIEGQNKINQWNYP